MKTQRRELPGGPVVRTQCFHCSGPGSTPSPGTKDPTSCVGQPKKNPPKTPKNKKPERQMKSSEQLRKQPTNHKERQASVSSPTCTNTACPGASSNTDGRIPKGGCSTKPMVATALKKSRRGPNSVEETVNSRAQMTRFPPPNIHFVI